jgi:hypothetical protein
VSSARGGIGDGTMAWIERRSHKSGDASYKVYWGDAAKRIRTNARAHTQRTGFLASEKGPSRAGVARVKRADLLAPVIA